MNKLVKLIFAALIMWTAICVNAYATDNISIIYPVQITDASAAHVFEVQNAQPCKTMIFSIDGKVVKVFENISAGSQVLPVESNSLSIGKHTFSVVAVLGDGTILQKEQNFTNSEFQITKHIEAPFTGYSGTASMPSGMEYIKGNSQAVLSVTDGDGESGGAMAITFPPKDGKADPYLQKVFSSPIKGDLEVSLDIKFSSSDGARFYFEGRTSYNKNANLANGIFKNGMVYDDTPIVPGKWYHVKVLVNVSTGHQKVYVDTVPVLENYSAVTASPDQTVPRDIRFMRLCCANEVAAEGSNLTFAIDNICFTETLAFPHLASVAAIAGDAELPEISSDATSLALYFSDAVDVSALTTENIELISDFGTVGVSAVTADADGKKLTLNIASALRENTEYKIVISGGVKYKSGKNALFPFEIHFKTEPGVFGCRNIYFDKSGSEILTSAMLSNGDAVSAKADFVNKTSSDRTVTLVLCTYKHDEMLAITAKSVVIPSNSEVPVPVQTPTLIFSDEEGFYMETSVINSWSTPSNIVPPVRLK